VSYDTITRQASPLIIFKVIGTQAQAKKKAKTAGSRPLFDGLIKNLERYIQSLFLSIEKFTKFIVFFLNPTHSPFWDACERRLFR